MILVIGGLGFIGTHVTQALVDLGESCVVVQRRAPVSPPGRGVVVEQVDLADREAFLRIGERHEITGILNLAGVFGYSAPDPVDDARLAVDGLLNVLEAARDWKIARLGMASTIGVYFGAEGQEPLHEDALLPMSTGHGIPAYKKIAELFTDHIANTTDLQVVNYRISGVWGPGGRPTSVFMATQQLVHSAVHGSDPDFAPLKPYAEDGLDMIYAKDCGRAIALLQVAEHLEHRVYNVGAGRPTANREILAAVRKVIPDARATLPDGHDPAGPGYNLYLDTTRLRQETGFEPAYDTEHAVADYIAWLRAGNER
jgi:UDP-glucose 4-epimerase